MSQASDLIVRAIDREAEKAAFLKRVGVGAWTREPLAGDASTRAYERLHGPEGATLIFMDQPPALETAPCPPGADEATRIALGFNAAYRLAAGRVDAFVACAGWLRAQGLSAPEVLAADPDAGLAVIEDLGDGLFAPLIAAGAEERPLYAAAVEALVRLHKAEPPDVLEADGRVWPLLDYDGLALKCASDLFVEWLPKLHPELSFGPETIAAWDEVWAPIRAHAAANASVFCHRDYHAENLVWLPDREGPARVGLLDFQDAVRAHPAWDLSMLLHDARRRVSPDLELFCLQAYFKARPDIDAGQFLSDYLCLGALNLCRIIGIFCRLTVRDGKPRYAALLPRLWGYLNRTLADRRLQPLDAWLEAHVPRELRR